MESQATGIKPNMMLIGYIGIFAVMMYYLMIRPQQKESKRKQELLKSIKSGDKVITAGGIHGIVINVKENTFIVKIADNVKIEISKSGIISVMEKDEKESK